MIELGDYRGMLVQAAKRQFARLTALGRSVDFDELMQEATEAFLRCVGKFDVDRGLKFSTYLHTALVNHFNLTFTKEVQLRRREVEFEDGLEDQVADDSRYGDPEQLLMTEQALEQLHSRLTPAARTLLEALTLPATEFKARYDGGNDKFVDVKRALVARGVMSLYSFNRAKRELMNQLEAL